MTNKTKSPVRQVLTTIIFYLSVILAALILAATYQIAGWVAQVTIALSLGRLVWLFAWGAAKNGWGWRV